MRTRARETHVTIRRALALSCVLCAALAAGACGRDQTTFDDVAQVLSRSCTNCHRPQGVAPFSLETAADVAAHADEVIGAITSKLMPPWDAVTDDSCAPPRPFLHNETLSDDDRDLLIDWIAKGMPPGTGGPALSDQQSELPSPYLTVRMNYAYVPGETDEFRCFVIDPKLTQDTFVTAVDFKPGNPQVVHHSSLLIDPTRSTEGRMGDAGYDCSSDIAPANVQEIHPWTPGMAPAFFPDGVSYKVPAGSLMIILIHYASHAHGGPVTVVLPDTSEFRLSVTDQPTPKTILERSFGDVTTPGDSSTPTAPRLLPGPDDQNGPEFYIPVGVTAHTETMEIPLDSNVSEVFAIQAHAHFAGTEVRLDVVHADGSATCLLKDRWNFFWQRRYFYTFDKASQLPKLRAGETVRVTCTYDNSEDNLNLVNYRSGLNMGLTPMSFGGRSIDEMCHVITHSIASVQ